ncbi:type VI secretion system protein TssA [Vibrio sp. LaRot3]|uniref:type VI secretion system protein TssA n=1 Tax=Vibrio sp. LaRot3 TaxID=2998829 RepID=UPI0022CDD655|nr:type VI secretion system ImpA family N-terminal domain-containing protein [Vibrio sp. LaRot3]MDA0149665.1 type VI secretion system ImpA family N-terminal domain-containing protein [Vibrio sp. LaRot3]
MVDKDSLLAQIADDSPSGVYLKLDRSAYRTLRNTYNSAQSAFRQLVETPDASSDEALLEANDKHWQELRSATYHALTQSSKDLEILGWYITSQVFTSQPFTNLADATYVLRKISEQFWDTLNPFLPDDKLKSSEASSIARERAEFRTKPLLQLVGESQDTTALYMPLQLVAFIGEITLADFYRAERSGELAQLKQTAQQQFDGSVAQTLNELAQSYQNFTQTEQSINEKCQQVNATSVSFKFIKQNIADVINAIKFLVADQFDSWPLDDSYQLIEVLPPSEVEQQTQTDADKSQLEFASHELTDDESTNDKSSQSAGQSTLGSDSHLSPVNQSIELSHPTTTSAEFTSFPSSQTLASRDHAFAELRQIADYFKHTEPHSPVSFLLEKAIRWGYMSLPELLEEMTDGNNQVLAHINQLTGMDNQEITPIKAASQPVNTTHETKPKTSVTPASNEVSNSLSTSAEKTSDASGKTTSDQTKNSNESNQTKEQTAQSSSGITDFEW